MLVSLDNFLLVIIVVGAWNLVSLIARFFYGNMSLQYVWHIFTGFYALYFYLGRTTCL